MDLFEFLSALESLLQPVSTQEACYQVLSGSALAWVAVSPPSEPRSWSCQIPSGVLLPPSSSPGVRARESEGSFGPRFLLCVPDGSTCIGNAQDIFSGELECPETSQVVNPTLPRVRRLILSL